MSTHPELKLTQQERLEMRQTLQAFMQKNPVRERGGLRLLAWMQKASFYPLTKISMVAMIIALFVAVGIGTTVAAETAVPGDLLYTVKVNINEEVKGFLSFSEKGKAEVDVSRAEARLEEAEELAAEGRLRTDVLARLESNFEDFSARVEDRVNDLKASGKAEAAAEVSSRFESALSAHAAILDRLEAKADANLGSIISNVRAKVEAVSSTRAEAEAKVSEEQDVKAQTEARAEVEASAGGKITAASNKIAEVEKFIESKRTSLEASVVTEAEAKLDVAEKTFAQARAKFEAKAFGEAFVLADRAHSEAMEAKIFVQGMLRIQADTEVRGKIEENGGVNIDVREKEKNENDVKIDLDL